jgi:chromosome segregation ATPase
LIDRRLEAANADLRKKLGSMEIDLTSKSKVGEYNATKMADLERKCAEMRAGLSKKDTLYDALEMKCQAKTRQIDALEEGIRSLQEKLDDKTSDIDALRDEIELLAKERQSGMVKKTESESQMKFVFLSSNVNPEREREDGVTMLIYPLTRVCFFPHPSFLAFQNGT